MDSADPVEAVIAKQVAIVGTHEQGLQALRAQCQSLYATQENFLASLQEIRAVLPAVQAPSATPATTVNPQAAYLTVHPLPTCSYDDFLGEFKRTFAHAVAKGSAEERLLGLQRGNQSIAEFIVDFRTAAAEAKWPDRALQSIFRCALSEDLKDQLSSRDEPRSFENLVSLFLRIDNCLREREAEKKPSVRKHTIASASTTFGNNIRRRSRKYGSYTGAHVNWPLASHC